MLIRREDYRREEYIWIDGAKPTAKLRSKTRVGMRVEQPGLWGFDGSSTNQAVGSNSDCVMRPILSIKDPVRKKLDTMLERDRGDILVMTEVLNTDLTPHASNTRAACAAVAEMTRQHEMIFGIEQEYTFFKGIRPLGFPESGYPPPQGGYYCGVGDDEVHGREVVEAHLEACLEAGLKIEGINAEVMPGQWEFQIGPLPAVEVSDQLWLARWLLYRVAEDFGINATLYPKPARGDWNGAGAHTNFSTREMRQSYQPCVDAAEALGTRHELHIANYGYGIEERLTGLHETCSYKEFRYGVSDRGASVRIPWQVHHDQKGYIEDRRPNANMDPYVVTRLVMETICGVRLNGNGDEG
jgi:glutamine synthetase